jgi:hypothetical protein
MSDKLKDLTKLFAKLGAPEPEGWASSQIDEGFPQLARFLFLRQAWRYVVSEANDSWIRGYIEKSESDPEPFAGVGRALRSLQSKGATAKELTDLVRGMQAELLFNFCYLLEDPGELEEEVSGLAWGLFILDENDEPVEPLGMLHESVLETDPEARGVQ